MTLSYKIFFCVFLFCGVGVQSSRDVPKALKTCNRDDSNMDDCLKKTIQSAIIALSDGIPEIGFKPLEPYQQKELVMEYKRNQISGKAVLKNMKSYGFGRGKVMAVRSNIQDDTFELEVDLKTKKLEVEGFLTGEGRLNALVLKAGGYFNNSMYDLEFTWKIGGKVETKKGEKYLRVDKFRMRPEVGNMTVHLPTVTDNEEINRLAYVYANRYWRTIYNELLPYVEVVWEKLGISLCNKIFSKIPYDKMFPPNEAP